jgi:hypothetical protein
MSRRYAAIAVCALAFACCASSAVTGAGLGAAVAKPVAKYGTNVHLGNGQSLAIGYVGTPPVSTSQPYSNVQVIDSSGAYTVCSPTGGSRTLSPLIAPMRANTTYTAPNYYPTNLPATEQPDVGAANEMTRQALLRGYSSYVVAASSTGVGAEPIVNLDKGGVTGAYEAGICELRTILALATGTVGVEAVIWTQGEADTGYAPSFETTYEAALVTLQGHYQADVPALTGQSGNVVLVLSQQNSSGYYSVPEFNSSGQAQLKSIGKTGMYVSGAKYQYTYYTNNPHLINGAEYRKMGEKYAEALWNITNGSGWLPLYPTSVATNSSTQYTVNFNVPDPPLVFDVSLSPPHTSGVLSNVWAGAEGFEAYDEPGAAILGATNASPIVIQTDLSLSITTGTYVAIGGVFGNTAANGLWTATAVDATHFSLQGSTGNGAWSGATVGSPQVQILLPISSVSISGSGVVVNLTHAATYHLTLGYAETPDFASTQAGGCPTHRCGLLRDSDPFAGADGFAQPNYALEFYWAVN